MKRLYSLAIRLSLPLWLALGLALSACSPAPDTAAPNPVNTSPAAPSATQAAQGAYLARAGNCMACHTAAGGAPWAGGRGIPTPFGTVYAGNLTPDAEHGLGRWSAEDFWQALHHGRSRDGRALYPAFPYTHTTRLARTEVDALWAYLQTLPAHPTPNRPHELRWPYNSAWALGLWRWLYFTPGGTPTPAPPADLAQQPTELAQWQRGSALVNGLGHCSACHTPRNRLGAEDTSRPLAGASLPGQGWYAPALNQANEGGVAHWPLAEVVALLKTGQAPQASVQGPMAEVVLHSTQHLSEADLKAMAVYLRALPQAPTAPRPAHAGVAPTARITAQGNQLYDTHCADCHGAQGQGVPRAYPPLAGNRAVTLANPANLVQTVLYGGFGPATQGHPQPYGMPPLVLQLSDADVAAVLSFVRNAWGNQAPAVQELDVLRLREGQH